MNDLDQIMLILSSLVYYDNALDIQYDNVYDSVLNYIEMTKDKPYKQVAGMSKSECDSLLNSVLNNRETYQAMEIINQSDFKSDAHNISIEYNNDLIVIYQGTASDQEWLDNAYSAQDDVIITKQQEDALTFLQSNLNNNYQNIYVGGHSKGGNKAQFVSVFEPRITQAFSFDGQGFNQSFILKYNKEIKANQHKIKSFNNEFDYVNILMEQIAINKIYIKSNKTNSSINNVLLQHSPFTLFKVENNKIVGLNDVTKQSEKVRELQKMLDYYRCFMNEEDWEYFSMFGISLLIKDDYKPSLKEPKGFSNRLRELSNAYINKYYVSDNPFLKKFETIVSNKVNLPYSIHIRDFTQTKLDLLINQIKEIEKMTLLETLSIKSLVKMQDYYQPNRLPTDSSLLDNYHINVLLLNDYTINKINNLFEQVRTLDLSASNKIISLNNDIIDTGIFIKKIY